MNYKPIITDIMEENKMKKHVTVAAVLQIVFGSLNIIAALAIAFALGFVDQFVDEPTTMKILGIVGVPLITVIGLVGVAIVAGAIGMLACKGWGKVLTLVMAGLGLLNIPIGTLKGVYIIWVLVQPETTALFEKGCQETSPTQ
ncbi:MAG: hypothetical protein MUC30_02610 [Bacteroidales bacterium]|jgi:hypothetical protein|nr:hypothetical protein [Bacteroidales bacterium]